jgi:protease II
MKKKKNKKTKKDYLFLALIVLSAWLFLALVLIFSSSAYRHFSLLNEKVIENKFSLGVNYLEERLLYNLSDYQFNSFKFSNDGQSFALIEEENSQECIILNTKNLGCYTKVEDLIFSPKGNSFAYIVKEGNKTRAIINNIEGNLYDWILPPYFFNDEGTIFVYRAKKRSEEMVIVNNQTSYSYDKVLNIFSTKDKNSLVFYALKNNKLWRGVINY